MEQLNERDYTWVKFHRVIIVFNYFGKVIEFLASIKLLQFCEMNKKFHKSQIEAQRQQFAIDAFVILIKDLNEI